MKIVTISDSEVIRDLTNNLKVTLNRVDQQSLMEAFRDEKKVEESKYILDMYKAENYAAVLRNKTDALTLIAINDIFKAHDTKYLFIPNIMGVLRKYKGPSPCAYTLLRENRTFAISCLNVTRQINTKIWT